MRCTRCNRRLRPADETLTTTVAEPICGPGVTGQPTRVRHLRLCRQCAALRRKTEQLFLGMVLLVAGVVLVALLMRFGR